MSKNHTYAITEGCIQVPRTRKDGTHNGTWAGRQLRPPMQVTHTQMCEIFGLDEVQRFIRQGWLKVQGLPPGLELGTIIPDHKPLPTEVTYKDPDGNVVDTVRHGSEKTTNGSPSVGSGPVVDLFDLQDADVGEPPTPVPSAVQNPSNPEAGKVQGRFAADPDMIATLPIGSLNALIADKGGDVVFTAGDETVARAYLSQDWDGTPEADEDLGVSVSGDLDPDEGLSESGSQAVHDQGSTPLQNPMI